VAAEAWVVLVVRAASAVRVSARRVTRTARGATAAVVEPEVAAVTEAEAAAGCALEYGASAASSRDQ